MKSSRDVMSKKSSGFALGLFTYYVHSDQRNFYGMIFKLNAISHYEIFSLLICETSLSKTYIIRFQPHGWVEASSMVQQKRLTRPGWYGLKLPLAMVYLFSLAALFSQRKCVIRIMSQWSIRSLKSLENGEHYKVSENKQELLNLDL